MKNYPYPSPDSPRLPATPPIPSVIQTAAGRLRPVEYLEWCRDRLGPRFTIAPIDMPPLVFLSDPSDVRTLIAAPLAVLHSGAGAAITAPLFGTSSFMLLEDAERMNGRNAIMPAFHRRAVAEHAEMVIDLADREVASWPLDTAIPLHPRLCALTLTVMLRTVFGADDRLVHALHQRMLSMLSVTASLVLQAPRLRCLPGWHRTWSRFVGERGEVDKLIAAIVAGRRNASHRHGDMLDMLLDATRLDGSPMTPKEVRDNLVAVIIAGHETTASALAWAFQLLAHHPSVQQQIAAEIDAGESEHYLQATVNEVLRHRPVFLFCAPRAVAEPIEIGGWQYRPPAHLLGCIFLMHHAPELFPAPQEFRPERFLDSRAAARTWMPWGGGRQTCPGRHLALLELRTVLRAVLSRLWVLPASKTMERARWRSVIVTPHSGSTVVLRERTAGSPCPAGLSNGRTRPVFF
jgi:cytochrome P450 family 135